MNNANSQKRLKKTRSWKSQFGTDSSDTQGDLKLSPFKTYSKNYNTPIKPEFSLFRTEDHREQLHRDSTDYTPHKRTKSKVANETKSGKKSHGSKTNSVRSPERYQKNIKLERDQDEIIYMQNCLIEEMKTEIYKMKIEKKLGQDSISMNENSMQTENLRLCKKVEHLKRDHELELIKIKKGIERKDEIFKEFTVGMNMKIEEKKIKIRKLKQKIEDLNQKHFSHYETSSNKALEELKRMFDSETKAKLSVEDELLTLKEKEKTLVEENNILIQNYQDIQNKCNEIELKLVSIADVFSHSLSKDKDESFNIDTILSDVDALKQKNEMLDKRCRNLTEKNLNIELDYQTLKSQVFQERNKSGNSHNFEKCSEKLARRTDEINECKHIIVELTSKLDLLKEENSKLHYELKGLSIYDQSNQSILENQISLLEEEINLLKTENKILSSKEKDLISRLKGSENARYHYREQTMILKEKLNSLEIQVKYQDSSSIDKRLQDSTNPSDKMRMRRNRTVQDLNELISDKSLPLY